MVLSEAGWISLANTCATFILSIFILWTRWSLNKYELKQRDQHAIEVVKLDDIHREIKEGTIAKRLAEVVADKMREELATTLSEAMALMGQIQLKQTPAPPDKEKK